MRAATAGILACAGLALAVRAFVAGGPALVGGDDASVAARPRKTPIRRPQPAPQSFL
jgi:hypothetical protein